jgi:hypothetical protein
MRYNIPILFAAVAILVGCHKPSEVHTQTTSTPVITNAPVASQPAFEPKFFSSFDHGVRTVTVTNGSWQITVSETSLQLSRPGSSERYPGWNAHTGWFVFIASDSRVWAYDGEQELLLSTVEKHGNSEGWTDYDSPKFPCAVPSEVYSRLSAAAQKAIFPND